MRRICSLVVLPVFLSMSVGLAAQESTLAPAPGPSQEVLRIWNNVGDKLIEMAEDFPEDKYDYRPTPEVRTFAEMLLHIAGSSYLFIDTARGQQMAEEDLSREKYSTKADVVSVLKKSGEEGAARFH